MTPEEEKARNFMSILDEISRHYDIDGHRSYRALLECSAVIDFNSYRNSSGDAIIHKICKEYNGETRGNFYNDLLKKMIRRGADVNIRCDNDETPLFRLIRTCHTRHSNEPEYATQQKMFKTLVNAGATVNVSARGRSILVAAVLAYNPPPIISLLLRHGGFDIPTLNLTLDTILTSEVASNKAAAWNTYQTVKLLIEAGADPTRKTTTLFYSGLESFTTPLYWAVTANFSGICGLFCQRGADPLEISELLGQSPLELAEATPACRIQGRYNVVDPELEKSTLEVLSEFVTAKRRETLFCAMVSTY
jgi:ankyrin repeat protein